MIPLPVQAKFSFNLEYCSHKAGKKKIPKTMTQVVQTVPLQSQIQRLSPKAEATQQFLKHFHLLVLKR